MVSERTRVAGIFFVAVIAVVATWFAFRNVASANFTGDDWLFLAVLRHIDSPLDIFTSNIGGAYFYRPVALFGFWLSESAFGTNAAAHYAINVALHGWVAFEIYSFAFLLTHDRQRAAWTVVLFLVFPATAATPLWISDRFDLIATAAMLCSLRQLGAWTSTPASTDNRLWAALAMSIIAFGSKETAFALAPASVLVLLLQTARPLRKRVIAACLIAVVATLSLLGRVLALGGLKGTEGLATNASAVADGAALWFERLPTALQTYNGHYGIIVLAIMLAIVGWHWRHERLRPETLVAVRLIAALAVMALGVIIVQSPITALILPRDGESIATGTMRLYYAPLAIAFIILATVPPRFELTSLWRVARTMVLLATTISFAIGSEKQSKNWATHTSDEQQRTVPALAAYAERARIAQHARPCIVRLPESIATLLDLDPRFKANLDRADPRVNCVLLTNPPQIQTITRHAICNAASVAPARSAPASPAPMQRSGTCTYFFLTE